MLLLAGVFIVGTPAEADENAAPAKPENAAPAKPENAVPAKPENAAPAKSESVAPAKPKRRAYSVARQLPPGLPRPGYRYRTTIAPATPYRAPVVVETDESLLITPAYGPGGYLANLPGTPLLPGSTTIPGYYGRPFDYDYQGPYYGGPYVGYYWRLPYACGVYGYC
ncbi:hypothetical protein [Bradyrhizobium sp.]|uniref:hypothetical protein n=1 Tax=Bradyrhizobium sp. TaxID=376 RepID=UPI0040379A66